MPARRSATRARSPAGSAASSAAPSPAGTTRSRPARTAGSAEPKLGFRSSPAKIASVGLALVATGMAGMLIIGVDFSWTALLPGFGFGTGLFDPTGRACSAL